MVKQWSGAIMRIFGILLVFLAFAVQDLYAGVLYARRPGTETPVYNLRISHIRTNVRIVGQMAVTHVDEEFFNDNNQTLEGFYAFSLPEGAKVDGLWLWVDGQRLTFIVKTREEAQRLYDSVVVGQRRDPAILESLGRNRFQLKVFPINPHSSRRIEIRYFTTLQLTSDGWIHYRYPLNMAGYQTQPVEQTTLRVSVESRLPVDSFATNFDDAPLLCRTVQLSEQAWRVDFGTEQQMYTQDFEIRYKPRNIFSVFPALMWREADANSDPYFICWHPIDEQRGDVLPRDLVFVLDASGSMDANRRNMVRDAVIGVLRQLRSFDRFRIVLFSSSAIGWPQNDEGMLNATPTNIEDAVSYIENRYVPGGATSYEKALIAGFDAEFRPDAMKRMLFLTDGMPNVGVTSYKDLLALIEGLDSWGVVFNPVVVFSTYIDVLYDLAIARGGRMTHVESGDDLMTVISRVMLDLDVAGLRSPTVRYQNNRTYFVYPRNFPSILGMEKLLTTGRLDASLSETVTVEYLTGSGETATVTRNVDFAQWSTDLKQVASYWAAKRIDDLLDQIRTTGEHPELKQSVINLSIEHQILTPYTAFLVLETNQVDPPPLNVDGGSIALPTALTLSAPYPQPWTLASGAALSIPLEIRDRMPVRAVITDILGREIAVLIDMELSGGKHILRWDGRTLSGLAVRPGVYYLRILAGGELRSIALTIVA
jgi:Ca-activated chloride channel homolog